ncbi:MAG: peptide ABC transporter substrate-binding protein, partial [Planctomycetota bacterium]|nr:peptide ABC transporter substrate-binding protein [Planctomycetota bacterium]
GLASSWVRAEDGRSWTFTLRQEARWSNGRSVTAAQVAASMRRALDPAVGSEYAYMLHVIAGARGWNAHGKAAAALRGQSREPGLIERLRMLHRSAGGRPQRIDVRRLPSTEPVLEALEAAKGPRLREALTGRRVRWTPSELEGLLTDLERFAEHLQWSHTKARTEFGRSLGVVAIDARTVRIDLARPHPRLLDVLALPVAAVVPPAALGGGRDESPWWAEVDAPVTGPYRLVRFDPRPKAGGLIAELRRNDVYWDAASVRQPRFAFVSVADPYDSLNRFTKKQLDWVSDWPREVTPALRKAPELRVAEAAIVYYFVLNCAHPALRDVRVRRALAMSLDRKAMLRELRGFKLHRPAETLVPASLPGYVPPPGLPFDPEGARELLAAAGHPGGKGLPPIQILYNTNQAHYEVARFTAAQWRSHLGVDVTTRNEEWSLYLDSRREGRFAACRAGWISDYADATDFLDLFTGTSLQNHSRWSDPRFDALLAEAREMHESRPRARLLANAEKLLLESAPCVPVYWYGVADLVQSWVKGFRTRADGDTVIHNTLSRHPLRGLWIER